MARRKRVFVKCPICGDKKDYWVAESAQELQEILFCIFCGENFDKNGKVVLYPE